MVRISRIRKRTALILSTVREPLLVRAGVSVAQEPLLCREGSQERGWIVVTACLESTGLAGREGRASQAWAKTPVD